MSSINKRSLSAAFIILLACSSFAGFSESSNLEYVSSVLWSKAYDAEVVGDHAYCAFLNGLVILDVANKRRPALVSHLYLGGGFGIEVRDNLACIAAGKKGLKVVDVSDVEAPSLLGSWDTPGEAKDVVVNGNFAYVADGESGLQIIDISKPSSPKLASSMDTPGTAGGLAVNGGYAFIADGESGLQVITITDPKRPRLVGALDTQGSAESVAVKGN
ncbi:MAG: hypothetical protein OEZ45_09000, partial [Candidatus Aminicenantes bacterium]|nr:hypothetical protein [Candidatus Aminicenantes bacterium]